MRRALALTIALALGAVSCGGGGGGVDPATWVASVCTTLTDWNDELESRTVDLQSEIQALPRGDFQGLQDSMLSFIDSVTESSEEAASSLEGAGVPDVQDGEEASEVLVGGIRQAREIFAQARDDIAGLDPDRPQQFADALQEIGARVQQGGQEVADAFQAADRQGVGGDQLDQAFNEEPACEPLAA